MTKDQRQALMLGIVLLAILGILGYVYKDSLLPSPEGGAAVGSARVAIPTVSDRDAFFDRADFQALRATSGLPVVAVKIPPSSGDPFRALK